MKIRQEAHPETLQEPHTVPDPAESDHPHRSTVLRVVLGGVIAGLTRAAFDRLLSHFQL
ncbi:hypothetical protein AB0D49_36595 [Streptomyces sp. NPDC048290]|uniref:hypothetical protein n=1 Tax=Streptomyces sp. NPDC048290 TaxID=3155811 RepID=UPI003421CB90